MVFCLSLLVMGVWPADSRAQERENPWAVSLSAGYGYDFQQLSRKFNNVYPLLIVISSNSQSRVQLGDPLALQLGLSIPLGSQIGLETGFGLVSRSINYWGQFQVINDDNCYYCRADLAVRLFRVPLLLDLIPLHDPQRNWRLHLKAGLSIDWSGSVDDFIIDGPASKETPSKVEVVDLSETRSYMFLVFDDELSASFLAGMEWERSFGKIGRLGWGLTFSRQLNSSTSLLFWGYDRELDNRVGGYFPNNLQFASLLFHARYAFAF